MRGGQSDPAAPACTHGELDKQPFPLGGLEQLDGGVRPLERLQKAGLILAGIALVCAVLSLALRPPRSRAAG